MATTKKEDIDISKIYGKDCILSTENFIKEYKVSNSGLSKKQVEENLRLYGINQISQSKPKKWYNYFFESLFTPFNSILLRYSVYFILY